MALWRNAWSGTQIPSSYNVNAIGFTPQAIRVQNYTGATLLVGTGPGTIGNGVLVPPYSSLPYLWTSSSVAWQFQGSYTPVSTDSILLELSDSPLGSAAANLYNPIVQNTLLVPISFGPNGGFYQGSSGTFANPGTGLKVYQDGAGVGSLEVWVGGTKLLTINEAGIALLQSGNGINNLNAYLFLNVLAQIVGGLYGYTAGATDYIDLRSAPPTGTTAQINVYAKSTVAAAINLETQVGTSILATSAFGITGFRLDWRSDNGPAAAVGANAGTGATISVAGTDNAGRITLTTGTNPAAGQMAVLTYNNPYTARPYALACHSGGDATGLGALSTANSTQSQLDLYIGAALSPNTTYTFDYWVIGH